MKKRILVLPILILVTLNACKQNSTDTGLPNFDYKLIAVKQSDKWGYVDKNGKMLIAPKYNRAYPFSDGLALVLGENNKWGYIDQKGNYVVQPQYANASCFSEHLAFVTQPGGYIQCIGTEGKTIFDLKDATFASHFSEGMAVVEIDGKFGFIDKTGKIVIKPKFLHAADFSDGLAKISIKNDLREDIYGFVDKEGKQVIEPQFMNAGSFEEGRCAVENGSGQMGYINKKGDYVKDPKFKYASYFSEGHAVVEDDRFGYINEEGKEVDLLNYDYCRAFKNNRGPVNYQGKWGYVDENGKLAIDMQYDDASCFFGDYAIVQVNRKFGIIDRNGKYLVSPQYDDVFDYISGKGLYDFFAPEGVNSHYVNAEEVARRFMTQCDENRFRGLDPQMGLMDVKQHKLYRHAYNATDSTIVFLGPRAGISYTSYTFSEPVDYLIDADKEDELEQRNPKIINAIYLVSVERDAEKIAEILKQCLVQKYGATETPNQNNYDDYTVRQETLEKREEAADGKETQSFFLYSAKMSFAAYYTDTKIAFVVRFRNAQ